MNDISNRTLAIILVAAILISFGGTLFGMSRLTAITGAKAPKAFVPLINAMASIEATVNLSVTELAEANWTPMGLNWSQGRVNPAKSGCTINSFGNTGVTSVYGTVNNCTDDPFEGGGGVAVSTGLNFTNQGNTNITLKLKMDKTADTFIGGTGVSAKWNVSDAWGQLGAGEDLCFYARQNLSRASATAGNWTAFATADSDVCDGNASLRPTYRNNTLRVDFEFVIPSDAPTGSKTAVITATYIKSNT